MTLLPPEAANAGITAMPWLSVIVPVKTPVTSIPSVSRSSFRIGYVNVSVFVPEPLAYFAAVVFPPTVIGIAGAFTAAPTVTVSENTAVNVSC